ncbi:hypothetical protein [Scytonema sp. HK-05]|uniref:hypothetical protein n=1 Tax=Scytonema sp. HK-05 TaxID=1137095 RepID=UPI0013015448
MFTCSMYETDDIKAQHELLNKVSTLVEQQVIQTTMSEHLGALTVTSYQFYRWGKHHTNWTVRQETCRRHKRWW